MRCAMCGKRTKTIVHKGKESTVFECGDDVQGVGSLEWYSDILGRREHCLLCYRCAEELAKIVKRRRFG